MRTRVEKATVSHGNTHRDSIVVAKCILSPWIESTPLALLLLWVDHRQWDPLWQMLGVVFLETVPKNPPNLRRPQSIPGPSPDDHQDDMQPPYPSQYIFFIYVTWLVNHHSEPPIPESDENPLSGLVAGRPRPPRRLQSGIKVTTQSSEWAIAHLWQADRPIWYKHGAAVWQCYSVRTHESRKTPTPSKKSTIRFRHKSGLQYRCGSFARKKLLRVSIQLLIFRYHGSTGAIDVILLWFKCQQADHFVGDLWICNKFFGVGTGAKIR